MSLKGRETTILQCVKPEHEAFFTFAISFRTSQIHFLFRTNYILPAATLTFGIVQEKVHMLTYLTACCILLSVFASFLLKTVLCLLSTASYLLFTVIYDTDFALVQIHDLDTRMLSHMSKITLQ